MTPDELQVLADAVNAQVNHKRMMLNYLLPQPKEESGFPPALRDNKFPTMVKRSKKRRKK